MTTKVELTDTFDSWRIKTNIISDDVGNKELLATENKDSLVDSVNEINNKVTESRQFSVAIAIALG